MGKIAFVFAGQGAQKAGMGKDIYEHSPAAKAVYDAGEAAKSGVKAICFEGPAEVLNETINTQPCLFLTDLAIASALEEEGIKAEGAAGFSLGEIPALTFAGAFSCADGFAFVQKRAAAMQECAEQNPGAMFAVLKLSAQEVEEICKGLDRAYPVNYNCPGQTVVACALETAGALESAVKEKKGRAIRLAVSGAFHSPFMTKASEVLAGSAEIQTVTEGALPVYANLNGRVYENAKDLLAQQVNHPVRWQETIEHMIADGFDTFVEVGPGGVLTGLIKKISAEVRAYSVSDLASLKAALAEIKGGTL